MRITRFLIACALGTFSVLQALAANTVTTISQVTGNVTVNDDVDYVITSDNPFSTVGKVDITNTEHAVLILRQIRPSKVISSYLYGHVLINGKQAVDGVNCQVKMYAHGAIVMPYAKDFKPLTVYSEKNYEGTAVNDFGLENSGGYMNTLSEAKLNNKIRSFKLKRGYMVTFSTLPSGRGYSRCFIADKEDLEIPALPAVLDNRISSYRVFQWYDAQKKGLASDTREFENSLICSAWCYDWGTGVNRLPDTECVPNHIYEDWPSSSACGSVTYSCHMKTNNEPGNSADDHPQDVATVLGNWENLMRTGMRLCSESSHDGSWNHLRAFIDSIDARGWRCDLLDLHCYWTSGFDNMQHYYNTYGKRPIWISEWVWGASWNNNGIFSGDRSYSTANQQRNADALKDILPKLNNSPYVERYAYWNSEADCSKIIKDGKLSIAGEYYASVESGLGYDKKYEKIPNNPRQYSPYNLKSSFDSETQKATLTWHEKNGEYNNLMTIEQKRGSTWVVVDTVELKEAEADYEVTIDSRDGSRYRIAVVDLMNKKRYSSEVAVTDNNMTVGSIVEFNGNEYYMGGNMLVNGDFELGLYDWNDKDGNQLGAPYFQAVPTGGIDGGAYLHAYGNGSSAGDAQSVLKTVPLKSGSSYYAYVAGCNTNGSTQRISTSSRAGTELLQKLTLPSSKEWISVSGNFTIVADTFLIISFRGNNGNAQFDNVVVRELFPTLEAAQANALDCAKARAEAFEAFFSNANGAVSYSDIIADVKSRVNGAASYREAELAIAEGLRAISAKGDYLKLQAKANTAVANGLLDSENITQAYPFYEAATTAEDYNLSYEHLEDVMSWVMTYSYITDIVKTPSFEGGASTGWNTKKGTFTGGDQRTATLAGKSCWNAWWGQNWPAQYNPSDYTMEINQDVVTTLPGLYAVECKATTEHYCVADQHAFIRKGGETQVSETIPYGVLDIPTVKNDEKWQMLSTGYVYAGIGDTLNIGFKGSRENALAGAWRAVGNPSAANGDNREGWWGATDFKLRYIPMYRVEAPESHWGTICLPSAVQPSADYVLYTVVGITADSTRICLEEAVTFEPGTPYIYYTEKSELTFHEKEEPVASPATAVNGLRGNFTTTGRYRKGSFRLVGNRFEWQNVANGQMESYSAYIYPMSQVPVVDDDWSGPVIFTKDYVSEEKVQAAMDGVEYVYSDSAPVLYPLYNLAGQRVSNAAKGIVISNGKKIKK